MEHYQDSFDCEVNPSHGRAFYVVVTGGKIRFHTAVCLDCRNVIRRNRDRTLFVEYFALFPYEASDLIAIPFGD